MTSGAYGTTPCSSTELLTSFPATCALKSARQILLRPQNGCNFVPPAIPRGVMSTCLGDVQLCQDDEICCSVKDNVSNRQTELMALSPAIPVMDSPVFQHLTRPHMRQKHTYGPKAAVSYKNPRFTWGSCHRGLDVSIRHSGNAVAVQCSNLNVVCKTKSKTLLELSTDRGKRPYSHCTVTTTGDRVTVVLMC
jgi:hypothetical protein